MLLARRFGERLLNLQRQGRIGTFPPIKGQEAAHLGAAARRLVCARFQGNSGRTLARVQGVARGPAPGFPAHRK